jgi:YVTN family beta-propeller protein
VAGGPAAIEVNPVTNRIYVACQNAGVAVIDGATDAILTSVTVGSIPDGVGVDRKRNLIYVSNLGGGTESVIDGKTNTVLKTITIGGSPFGVAVDQDANRIYVGNLSGSFSVIDGSTWAVIDTVTQNTIFGSNVALDRSLHMLLVTGTANNVLLYDTSDDSFMKSVPVGQHPTGVRINATTHHAYVPNQDSGTVSVIDTKIGQVVHTITVQQSPTWLGIDQHTWRVYVSNQDSASVSVIKDNRR